MSMVHYLTLGHLDEEAIRGCAAVTSRPLDEALVRRIMAEFPGVQAEIEDGCVILPWHGLGDVRRSEAFALRLCELTGCLIADRRNGRLIDPEELTREERAAG